MTKIEQEQTMSDYVLEMLNKLIMILTAILLGLCIGRGRR